MFELIEDSSFKQDLPLIFKIGKSFATQQFPKSNLTHVLFKPIESQFITVKPETVFDNLHKHLEYFPMVNQRVFAIGGNESVEAAKDIMNIQFAETYKEFVHVLIHQDQKLTNKHLLQLCYFLQLQDRTTEAIRVFQTIQDVPSDSFSAVAYDYMTAYFDFFTDSSGKFSKARELSLKYENYPIQNFKSKFAKIRQQLIEIDQATAGVVDDQIEGETTANKEETTSKAQNFKKVEVDKKTGAVEIESENIEWVELKYYLIDAEILFSRSPFLSSQAEQFSYVQPFAKVR